MLIERDHELTILRHLLTAVQGGAGRVAVIEGPPGIGKTRLLDDLRARAADDGLSVVSARGSEFEREFPFGVARQLFEPLLRDADPALRAELLIGPAALVDGIIAPVRDQAAGAGAAGGGATRGALKDLELFHALYWLCTNVAARTPLVIVLDDAQWVDDTSLGWIRYLAARIEDLPIALILAIRSDERSVVAPVVDDVQRASSFEPIRLRPLSDEGISHVLRGTLGRVPEHAMVEASKRATGGIPSS